MDTPVSSQPVAVPADKAADRRARSRTPLKIILIVLFITTALWVFDLYTRPNWDKIISFLQGYFFGSFVMAWILQRADRMTR
jgi:uncharacterized membrane protein YedE/YeeE